jgi:hypothetical protein
VEIRAEHAPNRLAVFCPSCIEEVAHEGIEIIRLIGMKDFEGTMLVRVTEVPLRLCMLFYALSYL